jgi:threonine dehydrogenase-like Zn-dependent dehydrogenase
VDEVTLVGSRCGPFPKALALLAEGHIDPRPLIRHRRPLAEAVEACALAAEPGMLKVLLAP